MVKSDGKHFQSAKNRYKQRHRELGLCVDCSRPAVPGKALCEVHIATRKERDGRAVIYRIENGLCSLCGHPLGAQDSGFTTHNRNECKPSRRIEQ